MGFDSSLPLPRRSARGCSIEPISAEHEEALKEAWGQWIAGLRRWDLFGGFTFDPKRYLEWDRWTKTMVPRRIPRDVAIKRFHQWVRQASRMLGRPIDYVTALEYHKNGWPHLHPLLDVGGLSSGDIARLGRLWFRLAGGNALSVPRDELSVCSYAAKYLSKDLDSGDVLLSAHVADSRLRKQAEFLIAQRSRKDRPNSGT